MSKIFLTGITGLVGSSFVVALFRERSDIEIICLTRKGAAPDALSRVRSVIEDQCAFDGCPEEGERILSKMTVFEGDVTSINPVELAARPEMCGIDTVFHCAADVNLGKDPEGRVFNINFHGTELMIELAKLLKVKAFHYVGTAYVAGKLNGRAMEDRPVNCGFNNPYEESKFQAEMLVRNCEIPFTIYRPSIIVGRLSDGRVRKALAFYRILEFVGKLKAHFCFKNHLDPELNTDLKIFFETHSSEKIYFVPVDYVQSAVTALFQKPVENQTYHITGDSPVTTRMIDQAISQVLHISQLFYDVGDKPQGSNKEEKLMDHLIGDLYPYFATNIIFDQTNVRRVLGHEALDWNFGETALDRMIRSFYIDFFPNIDWLQRLVKKNS